jgi:hypothetical protein
MACLIYNGERVRLDRNIHFSDLIVREEKGDGNSLKVPAKDLTADRRRAIQKGQSRRKDDDSDGDGSS